MRQKSKAESKGKFHYLMHFVDSSIHVGTHVKNESYSKVSLGLVISVVFW